MELIVKGSYLFYYLWVRGVTRPPPAGLEKDRVNFHYDHISTDRFARYLTMDDYTYLRLLCSIGYKPWQTHQRHYLIEQFSELLFKDIIQVYELPERYRDVMNRYNFGLSFHEGYEKFEAEEKAKQSTGGQNISGTTAASSAPQEDELLPAIGPGNRPATLGPHDGQPLDGLHNQQWDKVDVKDNSFKTVKQVDMDNLGEDEEVAKEALLDQGKKDSQIKQLLSSGNDFKTKPLEEGSKLYGFDRSDNKYGAKKQDSMYWLDEKGYNDVKLEYYKNDQWDKEGLKNHLALPCMNRADVIDTVTLTEDQQVIESTVGIAREQIGYTNKNYTTGMLGKIMPGGGKQITPDANTLSAVARLSKTP